MSPMLDWKKVSCSIGNLKQELKHKQGEICLLWFPRDVPILFPHVFDYDFVPGLEIN